MFLKDPFRYDFTDWDVLRNYLKEWIFPCSGWKLDYNYQDVGSAPHPAGRSGSSMERGCCNERKKKLVQRLLLLPCARSYWCLLFAKDFVAV